MRTVEVLFVTVAEMGPVAKKIGRAKNCGEVLTDSWW